MVINGRFRVRMCRQERARMITADTEGQVHISTHDVLISRGVDVLESLTGDVVQTLVPGLPPRSPVIITIVGSDSWAYRRYAETIRRPHNFALTCSRDGGSLLFLSDKVDDWHGNEYRTGIIRLFEIEGEECRLIDRRTNHRPGDRPL